MIQGLFKRPPARAISPAPSLEQTLLAATFRRAKTALRSPAPVAVARPEAWHSGNASPGAAPGGVTFW
eukprot:1188832-Prorocentrum_minimum.AAC.1